MPARQLTVPGTPAAGDPTLSSAPVPADWHCTHVGTHIYTQFKKQQQQQNFLNSQDQTGKMTRPNKWRSLFEANMAERIRKVVCISVFPH